MEIMDKMHGAIASFASNSACVGHSNEIVAFFITLVCGKPRPMKAFSFTLLNKESFHVALSKPALSHGITRAGFLE